MKFHLKFKDLKKIKRKFRQKLEFFTQNHSKIAKNSGFLTLKFINSPKPTAKIQAKPEF